MKTFNSNSGAGGYANVSARLFPFIFLMHPALMLGIGQGALDAALGYLRLEQRTILPEFKPAAEDPMVRFHLGDISIRLRSAQALLMEVSRRLEDPNDLDAEDIGMDVLRAKVACVQASLVAGERVFELTGARGTAAKFRFDRFWRNARVFSVHDGTDSKIVWVGGWELNRTPAPMFSRPKT